MSRFKKREKINIKKKIDGVLILILTSICSIVIYDMYLKIDTGEYNIYGKVEEQIVNTVAIQEIEEKINASEMLEEVTNAVVGISRIKNAGSTVFTTNGTSDLGMGSGVVVSENGYILTNWHVSGSKLNKCFVTLKNGNTYEGEVVWADEELDLSIVKIDMINLDYIKLGDSDGARLGTEVYAIGNPLGYEFQRTVTKGIISGVNRTVKLEEEEKTTYLENLIQTDATINVGNSGGPLILETGEMIGITTVKITSAEGIGFAVPINMIKPIINSFVTTGEFKEAYLGIFGFDKNVIPYMDETLDFDVEEGGIYVATVVLDGPLYKSGLKAGDVILQIDNIQMSKMADLKEYIYTKKPGDTVSLKALQNNDTINISVVLGEKI